MTEAAPVIQMGERGRHPAGPDRRASDTAVAVARAGGRCLLLTPSPGDREMASAAGVRWESLPLRTIVDVGSMRRVARLSRRYRRAVLHTHGPIAHAVALGALALGGRFRLVASRTTSFPLSMAARLAFRTRWVNRVEATCEAVRRVLVDASGVSAAKVTVVYPGVDVEAFDPRRARPAMARQDLGVAPEARLVLHVGAQEWKGWREALAALPHLRASCPDAHLVLVGSFGSGQRRWVEALARDLGVADAVTVLPAYPALTDLMAASELFIDASWAGNGIARPLCQAMAMGRPVVATRSGGSPELVEDGVTGVLVPPRDPATLAAAAARLLRDTTLAHALADAARQHVAGEFTVARRAARLLAIYEQAGGDEARDRAEPVRPADR